MTSFPRTRISEIPGKGQGLVALEDIARGTLIISEEPCMKFPRNVVPNALGFQLALALFQRTREFIENRDIFMSFPCAPGADPISGRLKHFLPLVGNANFSYGLLPTICKCNHICPSPVSRANATYFWEENLGRELLRATSDIPKDTEITVSYIAIDDDHSMKPEKWGFACTCNGCRRSDSEKKSAQRLAMYRRLSEANSSRYFLDDPLKILNDLESMTIVACQEGHDFQLVDQCFEAFQLCAMCSDAENATKWIRVSMDVAKVYKGPDSDEVKSRSKALSNLRRGEEWGILRRKKLRGPSEEILAYAYPPSMFLNPSTPPTSMLSTQFDNPAAMLEKPKLSKGQKKLARAKAKKAAAKAEHAGANPEGTA